MEQKELNEYPEVDKAFDPVVEADRASVRKAARILASTDADYRIEFGGEIYGNRFFRQDEKLKKQACAKDYSPLIASLMPGERAVISIRDEDELWAVCRALSNWAYRNWGASTYTYKSFTDSRQIVFTRLAELVEQRLR